MGKTLKWQEYLNTSNTLKDAKHVLKNWEDGGKRTTLYQKKDQAVIFSFNK